MANKKEWGSSIWTLFHVLAELCPDRASVIQQILFYIVQICNNLPCPDCAQHARMILGTRNLTQITTKADLRIFCLTFHNIVNKRLKVPMFLAENLVIYKSKKLSSVFIDFANKYNAHGSPKLMSEDFHRSRLIADIRKWLMANYVQFKVTN